MASPKSKIVFVTEDPEDEQGLSLIPEVPADAGNLDVKPRKRSSRKHKVKWMKRPMAIADLLVEIQDPDLRENALRCLSTHLIEKRAEDPDRYRNAGFSIFYSCGTLAILLQEICMAFYKMCKEELTIRASKRLANVLTLFQAVAANEETRLPLLKANIPIYLTPFIQCKSIDEHHESLRTMALSIFGILCQSREPQFLYWALENEIISSCIFAVKVGSELSKVVSMYTLESLLYDSGTLHMICEGEDKTKITDLLHYVVMALAAEPDFSPRLLFHVIRCYVLLCQHPWSLDFLSQNLPVQLQDDTFTDISKEYPKLHQLHQQLLINTGKIGNNLPFLCHLHNKVLFDSGILPKETHTKKANETEVIVKKSTHKPIHHGNKENKRLELKYQFQPADDTTPLRPINLNSEEWSLFGTHHQPLFLLNAI